MVHVQRAGAIVIERKQAHQTAIEVFGEGIESDQALGRADGGDGVALHFKEAEQLFERLQMALAEPLPLQARSIHRSSQEVIHPRYRLSACSSATWSTC